MSTELILAFDTETTGFVKDRLPVDHPEQPHLVQLSALVMEPSGKERGYFNLIVRPNGYTIPAAASNVHGITTEIALACGVPLPVAVAMFNNVVKLTGTHVAHNMPFDDKVMGAAYHRVQKNMPVMNKVCTVDLAGPILAIPPTDKMRRAGFTKYKPPSLAECAKFFFEEDIKGAHDAGVDTRMCARVYLETIKRAT